MRLTAFVAISTLCAGSCGLDAPSPDVAMRVEWAVGEPEGIPFGVTWIELRYHVGNLNWSEPTLVTVADLPLQSGSGQYADIPLLRNLPPGRPIEVQVRGLRSDRFAGYIGTVGPLVFRPGERRYVVLRMYEIGARTSLPFTEAGGRFLHTATALSDGRVLIAGGFTSIETAVPCPPEVPLAIVCHRLTASRSAWVFTPSSGFYYEVGGMSEPRAGHTATVSADGRVLIAGGARAAVLALVPSGDTLDAVFLPGDDPATPTASSTSEMFAPETPSETDDIDSDGDPGRGSFVAPGALGEPQFLGEAPGPTARPAGAGAFQTTTALRNGGLFTAGGLSLDLVDGTSPVLVDAAQVLYPELPPL